MRLYASDSFQLISWSSVANIRILVRLSYSQGNQKGAFSSADHVTTNTRLRNDTYSGSLGVVPYAELESVLVKDVTGNLKHGQCYVILKLYRGGEPIAVLACGYLVTIRDLTLGVNEPPTSGPGALRLITGTDPAANVEILETVPTGARWQLISVTASLATDANPALRTAGLYIDDGATFQFIVRCLFTQTINLTYQYIWLAGYPLLAAAVDVANAVMLALPNPVELTAGWRIRTLVTNRQATDNWGAPVYVVREWIEPLL